MLAALPFNVDEDEVSTVDVMYNETVECLVTNDIAAKARKTFLGRVVLTVKTATATAATAAFSYPIPVGHGDHVVPPDVPAALTEEILKAGLEDPADAAALVITVDRTLKAPHVSFGGSLLNAATALATVATTVDCVQLRESHADHDRQRPGKWRQSTEADIAPGRQWEWYPVVASCRLYGVQHMRDRRLYCAAIKRWLNQGSLHRPTAAVPDVTATPMATPLSKPTGPRTPVTPVTPNSPNSAKRRTSTERFGPDDVDSTALDAFEWSGGLRACAIFPDPATPRVVVAVVAEGGVWVPPGLSLPGAPPLSPEPTEAEEYWQRYNTTHTDDTGETKTKAHAGSVSQQQATHAAALAEHALDALEKKWRTERGVDVDRHGHPCVERLMTEMERESCVVCREPVADIDAWERTDGRRTVQSGEPGATDASTDASNPGGAVRCDVEEASDFVVFEKEPEKEKAPGKAKANGALLPTGTGVDRDLVVHSLIHWLDPVFVKTADTAKECFRRMTLYKMAETK